MKMYHCTRVLALLAIGLPVFLSSCDKDDDKLSSDDFTTVSTESITDSYYEDADDMTLFAIHNKSNAGGRVAQEDDRLACATITIAGNQEIGTVVIDFGAGCEDPRGNVRKGKINLAYSGGPAGTIGFTVVTTFENYSINNVGIQGTRTTERVAPTTGTIRHHIVLENGKAMWSDGTSALRDSDFYREIFVAAGEVRVEGEATGTNRQGRTYTMNITQPLIYKKACAVENSIHMAVEGVKVFTANGRQTTIDFGDGTCDRVITVTINGVSRDVTVGKNG